MKGVEMLILIIQPVLLLLLSLFAMLIFRRTEDLTVKYLLATGLVVMWLSAYFFGVFSLYSAGGGFAVAFGLILYAEN